MLTIVEYSQINTLFDEARSHINNVPWANTIRAVFTYPISFLALKIMLKKDVFGDSSLNSVAYQTYIASRVDYNINKFNNQLIAFSRSDLSKKTYF